MHKPIILIGFMGTGKDTVGRELARRTKRTLLSIDKLIELQTGKTISDIFRDEGETSFRKYEDISLSMIWGLPNTIIATGGGIIGCADNRRRLKEMGVVVHLTASLETIKERLGRGYGRPLAQDEVQLERLYNERRQSYAFADLQIATDCSAPGEVAEQIMHNGEFTASMAKPETITIRIETVRSTYPVYCGADLLTSSGELGTMIKELDDVCVITNPLVGALYLDRLLDLLQSMGAEVTYIIVPDGEQVKTLRHVQSVYDQLTERRFPRSGILIGLGGGVTTDLVGFVAATFKRGTKCVFVPTTLLGQVDAAIGGKNGINHDQGKNMIGTFYQPTGVIIDLTTIQTLSDREFRNGLAEIIKYAVIRDPELFSFLEKQKEVIMERDVTAMIIILTSCIKIKGDIVAQDEDEKRGVRQQLNFGHTVGHIIETMTGYHNITHGEAVAMGMVVEANAAVNRGSLKTHDRDRVVALISSYGLPVDLPPHFDTDTVRHALSQDKKASGNRILLPVLYGIGQTKIEELLCSKFL